MWQATPMPYVNWFTQLRERLNWAHKSLALHSRSGCAELRRLGRASSARPNPLLVIQKMNVTRVRPIWSLQIFPISSASGAVVPTKFLLLKADRAPRSDQA